MENRVMKILTIDDNQDNLTILKTLILEKFPNTIVLPALNGQSGLDIAMREEPDMILLDILMPDMDGYEVCRRLKTDEQLHDIPVIFITAMRNNKESRIKALECGAEAFLSKPIDESELAAQLRAMFMIRNAILAKKNESERLSMLVDEKTSELRSENAKRAQSEEALLEAQVLAHIGSFEFDMKTNLLSCSDEGLRICNLNQDDLEGAQEKILQCVHPDDKTTMIEMNQKAILEGRTVEFYCRMNSKNGETRHVFMRVRPVFDDNGICVKTSGIIQDVTESKLREELLNQNMKNLLESQRIAHIGTWRLDLATNCVVWSEELYKMYGFDPALPPPPYTEHMKLFTPESWDRLSTSLDLTRTRGIPYELELQTVTAEGSNGWMWVRGEAETDQQGNIIAIWGAAQDITNRKKTEIELKEGEDKFQLLFNQAPLGYQSLDFEGRFIEVNQQWLDTFGYTRDEVIGKWFGDFLCSEYIDSFHHCFTTFKSQGNVHTEFEMLSKDGKRLFIAFVGKIAHDVNGRFVQTHCILQDITELKKAEKQLEQSEHARRLLLDHLQVAIIVHNVDSSISYSNSLAEELLGVTADQIHNKHVSDEAWHFCDRLGEPLSVDAYPFSLVYNSKKALVDYEMGIIFEESRKIKWVKVNGFNIEDDNGSISGVLISFIDITEKKIAEQALLESEERYKYLFENSGVGIGYYTTDGTVISYNQKALENIGGKLEDYIGKSIRTLFPNEEAEIYFSRIKRAISSDKPQEYLDHLVMNSAHKWFSSVFTRVTGASGQIIGVQIASLDVSDRKYAEETAIDNAFKFQSLFDEISTGAAIYKVINDGEYGQDYIIQGFNKAALKGEGKELAEVIGKSLYDLRPNIDQYGLIPVFRSVWKTGKPEFFPSKIYIDEKFSNWYENRVYKLTTGEIVALFDDVTEKKRAEEDIEYLAYHDYLTDAYNRRYFENEYAEKNTGEYYPLAIVTGDLNGLKLINDSFGHHSGDLAIQQFATDIRKQIPKDAVLARIGGDEFAVLLTRNSEAEAKKLAGELQSSVQIQVKDNKGHDVDAMLTATFGYSSQSFPGQDMDELVKEVETFMNRRKFLENTSKRSNVIDAIMSTLFEKSEREQQHSIRVSSIATAIATEMGLDDATVAKTRVAGALHDIGKIGIDESILNKSERLSDQEWEVVKQHTIRSARILASVDEYLDIVPIVKAHHERIDGCGYPAGLTEKQIPIEAKIIAVADSFDAMTVSRPYRNAISKKLAADELRRCAGSQFDPNIVEIFVNRVMANMEQGTSMT